MNLMEDNAAMAAIQIGLSGPCTAYFEHSVLKLTVLTRDKSFTNLLELHLLLALETSVWMTGSEVEKKLSLKGKYLVISSRHR
jgi:hypothetical protein